MTTHPGDVLREAAYTQLDIADTRDENALLRLAIVGLGSEHEVFSANDLSDWLRGVTNPNRRGRMFGQLAKEGVLEEVGSVKSANPKAHGKRVITYRLAAA